MSTAREWLRSLWRRLRARFLSPSRPETDSGAHGEAGGVLSDTFPGGIRTHDLFARDYPASLEGPPETWGLARLVIDHGCYFFWKLGSHRSESVWRDVVVMALFRRILITGEAVRSLLARGLQEPAFATFRTLLELERDLHLVILDSSDTRARRLAAFLSVKGRRHFARAAGREDTRRLLFGHEGSYEWFTGRSRSFRDLLASEDFNDVAEKLKKDDHWHGFTTQEEAFEKAGMCTSYDIEYQGASLFVHGSNVEHDLADADDTTIQLKALAQRDPDDIFTLLGRLTIGLIGIYRLIWEDRGKPEYQEPVEFEDDDGDVFPMPALNVLTARALSIFPNPVTPEPR